MAASTGLQPVPKASMAERRNGLNRVEFLTALVQLAIHCYVLPGKMADVSNAVARLLQADLYAKARSALVDPDDLRRRVCYRRDVTESLAAHQPILSGLYKCASAATAASSSATGLTKAEAELLNLSEWKGLLRALRLIDVDLTETHATLCFARSRMAVIDDATPRGHLRETHLPYESFLEALCRVAMLKALPTDDEIEAAGARDAGVYLEDLRSRDVSAYAELLRTRKTPWGGTPPQPEPRCVAHLLAVIAHQVELAGGPKKIHALINGRVNSD